MSPWEAIDLKEHVEIFMKYVQLPREVLAGALQSSFENGHFDQFALIQSTLKDSALYQSYLSSHSYSTQSSQKNNALAINTDSLSTSVASSSESQLLFSSIVDSIDHPEYEIPFGELIKGKKVAEGASSTVYEGTYYGMKVALKVSKPLYQKLFSQEIKMLAITKHPGVLQFFGYSIDEESMSVIIVMEFVEHGSLSSVLYAPKREKSLDSIQKKTEFLLDIGTNLLFSLASTKFHACFND